MTTWTCTWCVHVRVHVCVVGQVLQDCALPVWAPMLSPGSVRTEMNCRTRAGVRELMVWGPPPPRPSHTLESGLSRMREGTTRCLFQE